jgi:hypothetical protein
MARRTLASVLAKEQGRCQMPLRVRAVAYNVVLGSFSLNSHIFFQKSFTVLHGSILSETQSVIYPNVSLLAICRCPHILNDLMLSMMSYIEQFDFDKDLA